MLFGQDRDQLRRFYCDTWAARCQGQPLEPLQVQIAEIVEQHPEYQRLLQNTGQALGKEYLPELGETNPFLHMGMHLAIREQLSIDRPAGIRAAYQRLLIEYGDAHQLEHRLMDCLAEMIWSAQKQGVEPDESAYLACVQAISNNDPRKNPS